MANGVIVDETSWKAINPEERDRMIFNTLKAIEERLQVLENKKWINSGCAFLGGVVGGIVFNIVKMFKG